MTLSRQLIIISIVFAILFGATLTVSINNMHDYLTQQLELHAQDTSFRQMLPLFGYISAGMDWPVSIV